MTDSNITTPERDAKRAVNAVTDIRYAENTLKLSQFAFDHIADAIIWVRVDSSLVYVNDAACQLLGYHRAELLRMSLSDIDSTCDANTWKKLWNRLREEVSCHYETGHITRDGRRLHVAVSAKFLDLDGKEYCCAFVRDRTEREQIETEMRTLSESLEHRIAERTAALEEEITGREGIEAALLDEAERMQSILDHAGQGFLTFGRDLTIDVQYSEECRKLFAGEIWGKTFPAIAYPNDDSQRDFLASLLDDILTQGAEDQREIYVSLLPDELEINGRVTHADYRFIVHPGVEQDPRLMVVLTDITEKRQLENRVEEERNRLKMVVRAVTNTSELVSAIQDFERFCRGGANLTPDSDRSDETIFYDIFRDVHTFKGTFAQLDMQGLASKLHDLESTIATLCKQQPPPSLKDLRDLLDDSPMEAWLESELEILASTLGRDFYRSEERVEVASSDLRRIERRILSTLTPAQIKQLLPDIRGLRLKPFHELLRTYPEYVERLAERVQKPLKPLVVEGENVAVDPERYQAFTKSLVHVFRNMVDHGIEPEDDRIAAGKDVVGLITCRTEVADGKLCLTISDDGNGVDIDRVKEAAEARKLADRTDMDKMTEDEILRFIFRDEVSTTTEVSEISGRGVGLAAVKRELDELKGAVSVISRAGQGVSFVFSLPLLDTSVFADISELTIVQRAVARAREMMADEMGLQIQDPVEPVVERQDELRTEGVVVLISIKGRVSGLFAMVFEPKLAEYLVQAFAVGELEPEEVDEYLNDTMAEIANIVLGNTLNALPELNGIVTIDTPLTFKGEGSHSLRFSADSIWTSVTETDRGRYSLSLLVSDIA